MRGLPTDRSMRWLSLLGFTFAVVTCAELGLACDVLDDREFALFSSISPGGLVTDKKSRRDGKIQTSGDGFIAEQPGRGWPASLPFLTRKTECCYNSKGLHALLAEYFLSNKLQATPFSCMPVVDAAWSQPCKPLHL